MEDGKEGAGCIGGAGFGEGVLDEEVTEETACLVTMKGVTDVEGQGGVEGGHVLQVRFNVCQPPASCPCLDGSGLLDLFHSLGHA